MYKERLLTTHEHPILAIPRRKNILLNVGKDEMDNMDEFGELKELVRQHKVCWEVWPVYHIGHQGDKVQIGFELELAGTHHDPKEPPKPGCVECVAVYDDLRRIAQCILPQEDRQSRYEISIFDSSIHYSAKRKFRGEVSLTIRILHKAKYDDPTDDCEIRCLSEMEQKLEALGAERI